MSEAESPTATERSPKSRRYLEGGVWLNFSAVAGTNRVERWTPKICA